MIDLFGFDPSKYPSIQNPLLCDLFGERAYCAQYSVWTRVSAQVSILLRMMDVASRPGCFGSGNRFCHRRSAINFPRFSEASDHLKFASVAVVLPEQRYPGKLSWLSS